MQPKVELSDRQRLPKSIPDLLKKFSMASTISCSICTPCRSVVPGPAACHIAALRGESDTIEVGVAGRGRAPRGFECRGGAAEVIGDESPERAKARSRAVPRMAKK